MKRLPIEALKRIGYNNDVQQGKVLMKRLPIEALKQDLRSAGYNIRFVLMKRLPIEALKPANATSAFIPSMGSNEASAD